MPTSIEERTAKVEGILEQMDKRLTNIEGEIVRINNRFEHVNDRFDQMNARFDQVNTRIDQKFNWLMGIMITMWISLIIAMILK
ncbi:MAG: hypothetical protein ACUZ8N_01790 [Candidatus Scalindua sp.]